MMSLDVTSPGIVAAEETGSIDDRVLLKGLQLHGFTWKHNSGALL